MLEHLGVELLLGVVGLAAEFAPKVCSGHRLRPEGPSFLYKVLCLGYVVIATINRLILIRLLRNTPNPFTQIA